MKRFPSDIIAFILIALFANSFLQKAEAGTCTSISRNAFGSGSVLTSSELNTQFNTVYNSNNAFDGGCVTTGTLEGDSLNTTDFQPVLNFVQGGCEVSFTDAATIAISKCSLMLGGNYVNKTTATAAVMGCTGCTAEAASTAYYVYVKSDSTGTTVNPLILTGAPNADGYDGSGNKVIGRFYNNTGSDIDTNSIDQWITNGFKSKETGRIDAGSITLGAVTTAPTSDTFVVDKHYYTRRGENVFYEINWVVDIAASTASGSGNYLWTLPTGVEFPEASFNTGANIYATATEIYGPIYLQILITATVYAGQAFIVPYNKTQYRIWVGTAQDIDGNSAYASSGKFIGSADWPINRAPTLKGSIQFLNNNWNY